ncbi:MAG: hypothetical protein BTN85_1226 [Candidatus Methanohalarchaeum thermophilum]|uniref:Uncharacterized protein n=1 Tax=Methanohalarchaeum thermophilum TaxID=1903181 RepID=A0A1Q6DWK0_METT1|nr:MAG: hypothetical protein BTN85_1226 [Candidatus Methanohalarchaeum thermophilum]
MIIRDYYLTPQKMNLNEDLKELLEEVVSESDKFNSSSEALNYAVREFLTKEQIEKYKEDGKIKLKQPRKK